MMSDQLSPVCGRAAGRFSTFTARAGRFGTTPPCARTPVRGQIRWTGLGVGLAWTPPGVLPWAWESPPFPPKITTAAAIAITARTAVIPIVERPRDVIVIAEEAS